MSKSHNQVGIDFGNLKFSKGSRMFAANHATPSPHLDDMTAIKATNNLFYRVSDGISYQTIVARIMRNVHTKTNELWITPRAYSSSTQRHKAYFASGFAKSHGIRCTAPDTNPDPDPNAHMTVNGMTNIYITPVLDEGKLRNDPEIIYNVIGVINTQLKEVDKPRLREATRRGTIDSCIFRAKRAMHNFSHNIPLDMLDADAYYDMQAMLGFLTHTAALPNIDDVRAAVRGYIALNTDDEE